MLYKLIDHLLFYICIRDTLYDSFKSNDINIWHTYICDFIVLWKKIILKVSFKTSIRTMANTCFGELCMRLNYVWMHDNVDDHCSPCCRVLIWICIQICVSRWCSPFRMIWRHYQIYFHSFIQFSFAVLSYCTCIGTLPLQFILLFIFLKSLQRESIVFPLCYISIINSHGVRLYMTIWVMSQLALWCIYEHIRADM